MQSTQTDRHTHTHTYTLTSLAHAHRGIDNCMEFDLPILIFSWLLLALQVKVGKVASFVVKMFVLQCCSTSKTTCPSPAKITRYTCTCIFSLCVFSDIAALTRELNHLSDGLNQLSEENEALREQLGLDTRQQVDLSPLRLRKRSELNKLNQEYKVLSNEVNIHVHVIEQYLVVLV